MVAEKGGTGDYLPVADEGNGGTLGPVVRGDLHDRLGTGAGE
jgi:hypothetical protein